MKRCTNSMGTNFGSPAMRTNKVIGDSVFAEVLQAFCDDRDFEHARKALGLFPCNNATKRLEERWIKKI